MGVASSMSRTSRRIYTFVSKVDNSPTSIAQSLRCPLVNHANIYFSLATSTQCRGLSLSVDSKKERPFAILGVQQIAIGCAEREPLNRLWIDVFGLQAEHTGITIETENVVEDILKVGRGKSVVEIDLMTPIDPDKSPKVSRDTFSWNVHSRRSPCDNNSAEL